jgi:protein TonB
MSALLFAALAAVQAPPSAQPPAVSPAPATPPSAIARRRWPRPVQRARLINDPRYRMEDYPAAARRASQEGVAAFRVIVGPDGRVSDCFITGTSGSAALDEATCNVMYLRARYRPARDAAGNPTIDIDSSRVRWMLPDE